MPRAPIGKYKIDRRIDRLPANPFGAASPDGGSNGGGVQAAPPVPPTITAPTLTSLTASLLQSAVTPSAQILAVWSNLETTTSETYRVQVSTNSGFTALVGTYATGQNQANAVLAPLKTSTTYYVRVQTIVGNAESDWSNTLSVTTGADTTTPGVPTSPVAAFAGIGDLVITWTNATSANLRDVEIAIYESASKVTQYALIYDATGRYVWPAAANLAATSGAGDPSVYVELRSRSWGGVFSAAVNASATKSAPAAPTVTHSWSGDTGTAGADLTLNWTAQTDAAYYLLNINSIGARRIYATTYTYTADRNFAENGALDPTLAYSITAVDGLNQSSTATAATATNAAPPTVTISGAASALQNTILLTLGAPTAADFDYYLLRIIKDSVTQTSVIVRNNAPILDVGSYGYGSYTVGVKVADVFGQLSTETISSAMVIDPFTLDYLRSGTRYTDNLGTSATTLNALKDGNTSSGGQGYT